ncbi:MAG: hypothetical protein LBI20_00690 [Holosporales bacterium]|jgi:hypothetical protein|nr:hypothetical protein [Holosporales bacterium]
MIIHSFLLSSRRLLISLCLCLSAGQGSDITPDYRDTPDRQDAGADTTPICLDCQDEDTNGAPDCLDCQNTDADGTPVCPACFNPEPLPVCLNEGEVIYFLSERISSVLGDMVSPLATYYWHSIQPLLPYTYEELGSHQIATFDKEGVVCQAEVIKNSQGKWFIVGAKQWPSDVNARYPLDISKIIEVTTVRSLMFSLKFGIVRCEGIEFDLREFTSPREEAWGLANQFCDGVRQGLSTQIPSFGLWDPFLRTMLGISEAAPGLRSNKLQRAPAAGFKLNPWGMACIIGGIGMCGCSAWLAYKYFKSRAAA